MEKEPAPALDVIFMVPVPIFSMLNAVPTCVLEAMRPLKVVLATLSKPVRKVAPVPEMLVTSPEPASEPIVVLIPLRLKVPAAPTLTCENRDVPLVTPTASVPSATFVVPV